MKMTMPIVIFLLLDNSESTLYTQMGMTHARNKKSNISSSAVDFIMLRKRCEASSGDLKEVGETL